MSTTSVNCWHRHRKSLSKPGHLKKDLSLIARRFSLDWLHVSVCQHWSCDQCDQCWGDQCRGQLDGDWPRPSQVVDIFNAFHTVLYSYLLSFQTRYSLSYTKRHSFILSTRTEVIGHCSLNPYCINSLGSAWPPFSARIAINLLLFHLLSSYKSSVSDLVTLLFGRLRLHLDHLQRITYCFKDKVVMAGSARR